MGFYVIIRGPLGVGKSTISNRLAEELDAKYFAMDRVLDEHDLTKDKEEGYISQRSFLKANEIIVPSARKELDKGRNVIFDGNFYWKSQIDNLVDSLDFPHYVFTLCASVEECIKRDNERDKTHGEMAAKVVYKKSTSFDYGTKIDTTGRSVDEVVKEILKRLLSEGEGG